MCFGCLFKCVVNILQKVFKIGLLIYIVILYINKTLFYKNYGKQNLMFIKLRQRK